MGGPGARGRGVNTLAWTLVYFVCAPPPAAGPPVLACTAQTMEAADCAAALATATALLEPTRLLLPAGCMRALPALTAPIPPHRLTRTEHR